MLHLPIVTVLAQPQRTPARIGRVSRAAVTAVIGCVLAAVAPHRASLRRLADIPLTVAGAALFDASFFQLGSLFAGLIVTGISLVVLEQMIADPDG